MSRKKSVAEMEVSGAGVLHPKRLEQRRRQEAEERQRARAKLAAAIAKAFPGFDHEEQPAKWWLEQLVRSFSPETLAVASKPRFFKHFTYFPTDNDRGGTACPPYFKAAARKIWTRIVGRLVAEGNQLEAFDSFYIELAVMIEMSQG